MFAESQLGRCSFQYRRDTGGHHVKTIRSIHTAYSMQPCGFVMTAAEAAEAGAMVIRRVSRSFT